MRPATYKDWKEISSQFTPRSNVKFTMHYNTNVITIDFSITYQRGLGGLGITKRPISEVEYALPGVTRRAEREIGKIGILGNGFSEVPLDFASRYRRGELREVPVVVDIFSYTLLHEDLLRLGQLFCERELWFPCQNELETVRMIDTAQNRGDLRTYSYFVGSGNVPSALRDFDLLINSHGPPMSSLEEQVSMLAVSGELYANLQPYHFDSLPRTSENYEVVGNTKGLHAVGFRSYIFRWKS